MLKNSACENCLIYCLKILCSKDCTSTGLNKATDSGIMDAKVGPRAIQLKNFGGNSLVVNLGIPGFNPSWGTKGFYKLKHKQKTKQRVCAK